MLSYDMAHSLVRSELEPGYWVEDCFESGDGLTFVAVAESLDLDADVYLYNVRIDGGEYTVQRETQGA